MVSSAWIHWVCAVTIAVGGLIYGIDTGIVSTTIAHDSFNMYMFHTLNSKSHTALTGAIVSCYYAGQAVGSFGVGWFMDIIGRRYSLFIMTVFTVVGSVIQTASINIGMFLAGRAIGGVATGGLLTLVPVYIAELSPAHTRGRLVGMKGLLVAIGYLVANWIGYATSFAPNGAVQWRLPLALQIPASLVVIVLNFWLPESPRWLVSKDRRDQARAVLVRLHGHSGEEFVASELAQIITQLEIEREERKRAAFYDLFTPRYIRRTLLSVFILQMTKLSGSGIISNYQSLFYKGLGYKGRTVLLLSGIYGFMGVIGQIFNLLFVSDKWSRRMTVCAGSAALTAFLILLTVMSALYGKGSNKSGAAAGIAFVFLFSAFYAFFFNSTVWVLVSELFPHHLRAVGNSFSVFCTSITNIWLSQVTPTAFANIAWKFYFVFIALNIIGGLIYFFFLPETNQKTLEEITDAFDGKMAENVVAPKEVARAIELEEATALENLKTKNEV